MIRFSKENVKLLHRLLAEATGGSMQYEELLQWVRDHE